MRAADANHTTSRTALTSLSALILVVIVGFSYREWQQYRQTNAAALQSVAIQDSINRLLSDVLDAETGQRGYLLTGEERYLQPYNEAVKATPGELAHIKDLLAGRPEGAAEWNRLRQAVDQKFDELRRTVELRRKADFRRRWISC